MEASEIGYFDMCSDIFSDSFNLFDDVNFGLEFGGFDFPDQANDTLQTMMEPAAFHTPLAPQSQPQCQLGGGSVDRILDDFRLTLLPTNEPPTTLDEDSKLHPRELPTNQKGQCQTLKTKDKVKHTDAPKKRKWEDSMLIFGANPETKIVQRKRKAFSTNRRKEVHRNRTLGACIQCKLRRGPVSPVSIDTAVVEEGMLTS
jgi:hypothetical protein